MLVTGAAGLIGSAVTLALRESGSSVVALDDFSIGFSRPTGDGIVWEQLDIADRELSDRLKAYSIDAVIHCAAHPGGRSLQEPSENVRVNAFGSMRLFEWCAHAKIPVVYLSSSAVYGEHPAVPIQETAPLRPGTVYAICKVACEEFLRVLGAAYGLSWTVLRLFATYGAGHRPSALQGTVNIMLTQLLASDTVTVRGSLDRVRDFLYVEDAARAIVESLFHLETRGQVLNVGTGTGVTVRELIDILCELLGRRLADVTVTEAEPTVGDPRYSVADITRLTTVTGFKPSHTLHEGLSILIQARRPR